MEEYSGVYGKGYQDDEGNLYLEVIVSSQEVFWSTVSKELILMRSKNANETYDVIVIDPNGEEATGMGLLENITLREWREFFVKNARNEWKKVKRFLEDSEADRYADC